MKSSAVAASSLLIVPNTVLGKSHGHTAPTDKLNIAAVGIGGDARRRILSLSVMWIGSTLKVLSRNIRTLSDIGITGRCMMSWVRVSTL